METNIAISDIVTAFDSKTIGSKVLNRYAFISRLAEEVEGFDWNSCQYPGQAFIRMSGYTFGVLPGDARRSDNPNDYVCRFYRGRVRLFRKRPEHPEKPKHIACVVYTTEAYLNDPDVSQSEAERIFRSECSHVLVAVIANCGPPSPVLPSGFVHNLAGGNNEALGWTGDEIRAKAREIEEYLSHGYETVAD